MTLHELLKSESTKHSGKPMLLDDIRTLANVSSDEWMNALIELVLSGCCVLSSATGSDGNSISMVQYIPSVVDDAATARTEPSVKEVLMKDNITASLTQFRKGQQQHNRQYQKAHTQRATPS